MTESELLSQAMKLVASKRRPRRVVCPCGKPFTSTAAHARFCGDKCRHGAFRCRMKALRDAEKNDADDSR